MDSDLRRNDGIPDTDLRKRYTDFRKRHTDLRKRHIDLHKRHTDESRYPSSQLWIPTYVGMTVFHLFYPENPKILSILIQTTD